MSGLLHIYAPDGAGNPHFLPLPPSDDEVARVLSGTARRIHRLLEVREGRCARQISSGVRITRSVGISRRSRSSLGLAD